MKQTEIKPCVVCKKGVAHSNQIAFFRVTVEHMVLNFPAIQRQHGLEQMLGGNAAIAFHMGTQEDMAKCASTSKGLVCQECWITRPAAAIWEALANAEAAEGTG